MYKESKMEKLTINLPPVELARIDILVEAGIYPNRTELIRTAVRKTLDENQDFIKERISQFREEFDQKKEGNDSDKYSTKMFYMGVVNLGVKTFEKAMKDGKKIRVVAFGLLSIDNKVTIEQIEQTVERIRVYGVLVASPKIKKALAGKR